MFLHGLIDCLFLFDCLSLSVGECHGLVFMVIQTLLSVFVWTSVLVSLVWNWQLSIGFSDGDQNFLLT